jgi:hypothetical protein
VTRAKISEYSATAGDNTDVNGVNIAEGCPPSSMNNMGREIMAALKRFQVGSDGDGVTVGGNLVVSGSTTANTLSTTVLQSDTINEKTATAGVTVDGVLLKDNQISTDQINEKTSAAGVTIDGVLLKDTTVTANTIKASGTSSSQGEVQFFEDTDNGTNYVAIKAPASIASNVTWTLPNADGTADQVLKTDGSGVLGWVTAGGASNLGDGSATTPSVNFSADTNTGVYRPGDDRLGFATNGALVGEFDGTNLKFNSGYGSVATAYGCRAWVNFNGTGTVAIRANGNVTSITDNGTGDYTVNFTTAMPDADYVVAVMAGVQGATFGHPVTSTTAPTTSAYRFQTLAENGTLQDSARAMVAIFR